MAVKTTIIFLLIFWSIPAKAETLVWRCSSTEYADQFKRLISGGLETKVKNNGFKKVVLNGKRIQATVVAVGSFITLEAIDKKDQSKLASITHPIEAKDYLLEAYNDYVGGVKVRCRLGTEVAGEPEPESSSAVSEINFSN